MTRIYKIKAERWDEDSLSYWDVELEIVVSETGEVLEVREDS